MRFLFVFKPCHFCEPSIFTCFLMSSTCIITEIALIFIFTAFFYYCIMCPEDFSFRCSKPSHFIKPIVVSGMIICATSFSSKFASAMILFRFLKHFFF